MSMVQDETGIETGAGRETTDAIAPSLLDALACEWRSAPWYVTSVAIHSFLFLFLMLVPLDARGERRHRSEIIIDYKDPPDEDPKEQLPLISDTPPVDVDQPVDPVDEILPPVVTTSVDIEETFQTDNDEPFEETLKSDDFSDVDSEVQGSPAIMGVSGNSGPGGGGPWGRRRGGHKPQIAKSGLPVGRTIRSVDLSLKWLACHQEPDGHWDCAKYGGRGHDVGVTSFALLAFLANGNSVNAGRYRQVVQKGVYWLSSRQEAGGRIGPHRYEAGIALMAMSEAYGMSTWKSKGARVRELRKTAQKCVDWAVAAQCPAGGFDYAPASQRNDTSVFGWWIMGLKSAKIAGLHVPYKTFERALAYMQHATLVKDPYSASVSYSSKTAQVQGVKRGGGSTRLSAVGLTCLQFLGRERADPQVLALANQVLKDGLPATGRSDFYRWYYASLGLFQMGQRSDFWRRFSRPLFSTLFATQVQEGTAQQNRGSWNFDTEHFGSHWGRVGQTALGSLMLSSCYREGDIHAPGNNR